MYLSPLVPDVYHSCLLQQRRAGNGKRQQVRQDVNMRHGRTRGICCVIDTRLNTCVYNWRTRDLESVGVARSENVSRRDRGKFEKYRTRVAVIRRYQNSRDSARNTSIKLAKASGSSCRRMESDRVWRTQIPKQMRREVPRK